jgi:FkbM family methyltransferase
LASINGTRVRSNNLIKVKATTLEKILDENNGKNIDLLSLDTEGYELEILNFNN